MRRYRTVQCEIWHTGEKVEVTSVRMLRCGAVLLFHVKLGVPEGAPGGIRSRIYSLPCVAKLK